MCSKGACYEGEGYSSGTVQVLGLEFCEGFMSLLGFVPGFIGCSIRALLTRRCWVHTLTYAYISGL